MAEALETENAIRFAGAMIAATEPGKKGENFNKYIKNAHERISDLLNERYDEDEQELIDFEPQNPREAAKWAFELAERSGQTEGLAWDKK